MSIAIGHRIQCAGKNFLVSTAEHTFTWFVLFFRKCKLVPICWQCLELHDTRECQTLGELNLPKMFFLDHFDVLTPLRALLFLMQQSNDKEKSEMDFAEIANLESHCSMRRNTVIWNAHTKNVVTPMRESGLTAELNKRWPLPWPIDDDFIQKICGILDVNTFEVRTPNFDVSRIDTILCLFATDDTRLEMHASMHA